LHCASRFHRSALRQEAQWTCIATPLALKISNLTVPFYTGTVDVRRSTVLKLTDPNLSFEYPGRSSLIGKFEYSGP
jgi:hypothetical protein